MTLMLPSIEHVLQWLRTRGVGHEIDERRVREVYEAIDACTLQQVRIEDAKQPSPRRADPFDGN